MPRGIDTSGDDRDLSREGIARRINPVTGKQYQGHITGDIRDTPEATEAYSALGKVLTERRRARTAAVEEPTIDNSSEAIAKRRAMFKGFGW